MASMLDLLKTIVGLAQARRGLRLADREFERMHEAQDAFDRDLARVSTEYDTPNDDDEITKRFGVYNEWAERRLAELEEKEREEREEQRRQQQPPPS